MTARISLRIASSAWLEFAQDGAITSLPWPTCRADTDAHLVFDETIQSDEGVRTGACDFWDKLGA